MAGADDRASRAEQRRSSQRDFRDEQEAIMARTLPWIKRLTGKAARILTGGRDGAARFLFAVLRQLAVKA